MNIRTQIVSAAGFLFAVFFQISDAAADGEDTKIVGPAMIQPNTSIQTPEALDAQQVTLPGQKSDSPDAIVGPAMISEQPTAVESRNALDSTDTRKLESNDRPDAIVGPAMDPSSSASRKSKKRSNRWDLRREK